MLRDNKVKNKELKAKNHLFIVSKMNMMLQEKELSINPKTYKNSNIFSNSKIMIYYNNSKDLELDRSIHLS